MSRISLVLTCGVALALAATGISLAQNTAAISPIGPDELAFSVDNMDTGVGPAVDFYRYASGKWQDRTVRPDHLSSIGVFDYMVEHVKTEMVQAIKKAAAEAAAAAKGSPAQQVGDLYTAFMNVEQIDALGIAPLRPELDRIDAINSLGDLSLYLGHYSRLAGDIMLAGIVPSTDRADATRTALYFVGGDFVLLQADVYDDPDDSPRITAFLEFLKEVLTIAGYDPVRAGKVAQLTLGIERELRAAQLTPVEAADPRNSYMPMSFAKLQGEIPELDLEQLLAGLGIAAPETVVQTESRYLPVLAKMLRERPLDDLKDYARVRLIVNFMPYLTTRFDEPTRKLGQALFGVGVLPRREERGLDLLRKHMGHPVSRVYVDTYFNETTRRKGQEMIGRIKEVFLERMKTRTWLTKSTRAAALDKLEKLSFRVGYPDVWIDYGGVEITRNDLVANLMNLIEFENARELAKIGKPVIPDQFNSSRATLPIIVNAGYNVTTNGFEVPAAIMQPPAFETDRDAPVYFCRLGAIIGHEMTHGFDSGGRFFDAGGNMRDWWTAQDSAAFEAEAQKLIDQANAFEVLPGLHANGPLNVRENMADVGGITFAYEALMRYLKDHPEQNVAIDGLTPTQRCFIAWAQLWTMKATDGYLRTIVATDGHPPNFYRTTAALQHVDAFYDAFGIKAGDPMWLAPERRVHAW